MEDSPDLLVCYQLTTICHLLPASLMLSLSLSIYPSVTASLYAALLSVYVYLSITGFPSNVLCKTGRVSPKGSIDVFN